MLVISGNAQRSGSDEPNRDHLAKMGAYFVGVLDLFGQNRFEWSAEEIGRDMTKDVEFGKS